MIVFRTFFTLDSDLDKKASSCCTSAVAADPGRTHVLERGHRLLACGEDISHTKPAKALRVASVKQEPTEVSQAQA